MNIEIFKDISSVVGCFSAIIALCVAIFKPIRNFITSYIVRKTAANKENEQWAEILKKLPELEDKIDKVYQQNEQIVKRVNTLESRVLTNEQDRLRSELYDCGSRCRRNIHLYPEEYEHVREVYKKYSEELGGNHLGTMEYEFITKYFNDQETSSQGD